MPADPGTLLALKDHESSLTLTAHPHPGKSKDERWYDVNVEADAHHFSGSVRDFMTESDLKAWRKGLEKVLENLGDGAPGGDAVLGGQQLPLFALRIAHQDDPTTGWKVEIELAPNTDDPYPFLRFRINDVEPFLPELVAAIDTLMRG